MVTVLVALAAGVVGFLAGVLSACSVLDEWEAEGDHAPTIASSTVRNCPTCGCPRR
jgi:hypothetical protein